VCANRETSSRIVILAHRRIFKVVRIVRRVSAQLIHPGPRGWNRREILRCAQDEGSKKEHSQSSSRRYFFLPVAQITPAGWLRFRSRTQSSLRRSRRIVSWSLPCHPQGFLPALLPNRAALLAGTGREAPGRESLEFRPYQRHRITVSQPHASVDHSFPQKSAPTSARHW